MRFTGPGGGWNSSRLIPRVRDVRSRSESGRRGQNGRKHQAGPICSTGPAICRAHHLPSHASCSHRQARPACATVQAAMNCGLFIEGMDSSFRAAQAVERVCSNAGGSVAKVGAAAECLSLRTATPDGGVTGFASRCGRFPPTFFLPVHQYHLAFSLIMLLSPWFYSLPFESASLRGASCRSKTRSMLCSHRSSGGGVAATQSSRTIEIPGTMLPMTGDRRKSPLSAARRPKPKPRTSCPRISCVDPAHQPVRTLPPGPVLLLPGIRGKVSPFLLFEGVD